MAPAALCIRFKDLVNRLYLTGKCQTATGRPRPHRHLFTDHSVTEAALNGLHGPRGRDINYPRPTHGVEGAARQQPPAGQGVGCAAVTGWRRGGGRQQLAPPTCDTARHARTGSAGRGIDVARAGASGSDAKLQTRSGRSVVPVVCPHCQAVSGSVEPRTGPTAEPSRAEPRWAR